MLINLPSTKPQANAASSLEGFRKLYLQQALSTAIQELELTALNAELDRLAPAQELSRLASRGVRGEFVFALPSILAKRPMLLGYYRLLLGFSQKEFYHKGKLGRFKQMEESGRLSTNLEKELPELCRALVERSAEMLREIGFEKVTLDLLDDLSLLTLGPQLRGGLNTRIGELANRVVFELIQGIVAHTVKTVASNQLELVNSSRRKVKIGFSSDPDISIFEEIAPEKFKNVVAIEIKGGGDKSNIWNRLGEAEKSHQSAKQRGFVEFWTIYNVSDLNLQKAREKSPTTNRFYSLAGISSKTGEEYGDFRDRLVSLVGIALPGV